MRGGFIQKYNNYYRKKRGIFVPKIFAGSRLLIYLISITTIIAVNKWNLLSFLLIIFLLITIFTGKNKKLLKKVVLTTPFLITAALIGFLNQDNKFILGGILISKLITIVMLNTLLLNDFNENSLLKAMQQLHIPVIFTSIAFFMFSYRIILKGEINRLKTAHILRGGNLGQNWFTVEEYKIWGQIIGAGIINALNRGDVIYKAMTLRGLHTKDLMQYEQNISADLFFIAGSIITSLTVLYINYYLL